MSLPKPRVGFDRRGETLFAARVADYSGRPQILGMLRLPVDQPSKHDLLDEAEYILSVPESLIKFRRHRFGDDDKISLRERIMFEIKASLPDDNSRFMIDVVPTKIERHQLSLTARESNLSEYGLSMLNRTGLSYRVRSLALAQGYKAFAVNVPGELICLADCTESQLSVALLYRRDPVALFGVGINGQDLSSESTRRRIVIEFRTLLDFHLEKLIEIGLTIPLATVIGCGLFALDIWKDLLAAKLACEPVRPNLNPGFLKDPAHSQNLPLADYIVALGLTIK